jgi:two-component system, sensor histidine kinase YesM
LIHISLLMKNCILLSLIFLSVFAETVSGQSVNTYDTAQLKGYDNNLNYNSQRIIQSMNEDKSPAELAEDYYNMAMELAKAGELAKAETYMLKAIELASQKKGNKRLNVYYRELARIQESLKKYKSASGNYQKASETADDKTQKQVNSNDARRVQSKSNPEDELLYLQQNAQLLTNTYDSAAQSEIYVQMANVNKEMNQPEQAIVNYSNALNMLDSNSAEYAQVKSNIADIMVQTNKYDEAIRIQTEVVEQSYRTGDVKAQIQQIRKLSNLYFVQNSDAEGLKLLQEAYQLAMASGDLKEAKSSLEMLIVYHQKKNNTVQILKLYSDFLNNLDTLIARDKSLIDVKLFEYNEERIEELEKEKSFQAQLIKKTRRYNIMLFSSVVLLLLLLLLLVRGWYSIRRRNKRIALQSLRREMNPHFIFNSLNSINQFIAENNELEANKYLSAYSNLMRRMMENSNKDYIPLSDETEQIRQYLELEKLRFGDKFDFEIIIDPTIDPDSEKIPNMLIQPNLENAVWHGLRYRDSKGMLSVSFKKGVRQNTVIIEDNGIGIEKSKTLKTENQKKHSSRGQMNVQERIRLLNELYHSDISCEVEEKKLPDTGVTVKIRW